MKWNRWAALPGVLAFLVAVLMTTSTSSFAASATCGQYSKWLYGAYRLPPSGVTYLAGSQADIKVRPNDLCGSAPADGHPVFSNAWAMLQGTGQFDGYAQIGYVRYTTSGCSLANNGCRQFFAEYLRSDFYSQVVTHWGTPIQATSYVFKATWKLGTGEDNLIHLILCDSTNDNPPGGTNCFDRTPAGLNWNPSSANWQGARASWAGETNDQITDMPGGPTARAKFLYLKMRRPHFPWEPVTTFTQCTQNESASNPTCSDTYSAYHADWTPASSQFEIWTDPVIR
jgi:hypothetical protein